MSGKTQVKAEASFTPSIGFTPEKAGLLGNNSALKITQIVQRVPSHNALSPIQAKLTINKPGDQYEQEADRIADQVIRMPGPRLQRQVKIDEKDEETHQTKSLSSQITPIIQMQEYADEEEEEKIQAKANPGRTLIFSPHLQDHVSSLRGGGQPLPLSTRTFFEQQFGYDFREVRIHTDPNAAESAKFMHARAYTIGKNMAFAAGQYAPFTENGRRLLAHELTHVIQQSGASRQKEYKEISAANNSKATFNHAVHTLNTTQSVGISLAIQRQRETNMLSSRGSINLYKDDYTIAIQEAGRLYWALRPEINRKTKEYEINRFLKFKFDQVLQVMAYWRRRYPVDLADLVEMRIGKNSEQEVREHIKRSEDYLRNVSVPESHHKEVAEKESKRRLEAERITKHELEKPSSELGRFIREKYYSLSKDKQESIQGLLYFVHKQLQEYRGWLMPGQFYEKFDKRYFLGASSGQTLWMDEQLRVFALPEREDLLEGMIRGVVSAAPWVPILKGVAIFATIVVGGLVVPFGAIATIGRAGMGVLSGEWVLPSGVLRIIGPRALAFYLDHAIAINEIGLFTVGLIVSVEGDIPGLIRNIKRDWTQALPLLAEVIILKGAIRTPKGSLQPVEARAKILPNQPNHQMTNLEIISKPKIGVSKSLAPSVKQKPMISQTTAIPKFPPTTGAKVPEVRYIRRPKAPRETAGQQYESYKLEEIASRSISLSMQTGKPIKREEKATFAVSQQQIDQHLNIKRRTRTFSQKKPPRRPVIKANPEDVREHVKKNLSKYGYELAPHARDKKWKGSYHAIHSEKQNIVAYPNQTVYVTREMCKDCMRFFSAEARFRNKPQTVIESNNHIKKVFNADGTVTVYGPGSPGYTVPVESLL